MVNFLNHGKSHFSKTEGLADLNWQIISSWRDNYKFNNVLVGFLVKDTICKEISQRISERLSNLVFSYERIVLCLCEVKAKSCFKKKKNRINKYNFKIFVMIKKEVPQYKYFVSCVDTILGHSIVEELRNDHLNDINPHIIVGKPFS